MEITLDQNRIAPDLPVMVQGRTRLLLGAAFVITLGAFWPTILSFHAVWTSSTYSHGYFVALLTVWLVWRERRELLASQAGWSPALFPMVGLTLIWMAATVINVQVVYQAALPALLLCWGTAAFGRRSARVLVPVALIFSLAIPFWEILIPPLQLLTIVVSGFAVKIMGIPAVIEGEIISITAGSFQIAESCAGLSYLLVALVVGALYAHLFVARRRTRVGVVVLAAIIAMVANWIRVIGLIVIGHVTQMESGLMVAHGTYGWVIFIISLLPFFYLASRLEKWDTSAESSGTSPPVTWVSSPADEPEPPDSVPEKWLRSRSSGILGRVTLASALAVLGPAIYFVVSATPRAEPADTEISRLIEGEAWRVVESAEARPFDWEPDYQGADDRQRFSLTDGEAHVYVDRLFYRDQRQGAELISYFNRIAPDPVLFDERVTGPIGVRRRFVRQALINTAQGPILVWSWFRVGGVETVSPIYAKILELLAFARRLPVAELVALSSACGPDNCVEAFEALSGVLGVD